MDRWVTKTWGAAQLRRQAEDMQELVGQLEEVGLHKLAAELFEIETQVLRLDRKLLELQLEQAKAPSEEQSAEDVPF